MATMYTSMPARGGGGRVLGEGCEEGVSCRKFKYFFFIFFFFFLQRFNIDKEIRKIGKVLLSAIVRLH